MDMKSKNKKDNLSLPNTKHTLNSKLKSADEENDFYENIVNTVREPLLILDKDLRVVKANQSFFDFFKVNPDETIGTLIYNLGNNQWDIPKLRELLETILPEKTIFNGFAVEHIFSTIGKRFMLLNARQIKRAFGKEKVILLAIEDITRRKREEKSLREKNQLTDEYLDILFDRAHTPIIIWDSSLVINRFNLEFEKLSGYESSEVIGKPIKTLFPDDRADSFIDLLKNHLSDKDSEAYEIDILTKDKNIKTVLWNSTGIFDKEDRSIVATIAQDITKRKQTTDKLAALETRYRRLFESAQDGILILNGETGKIIDVNSFLCELLDYSKEKFVDKELWQIGFFKDIAANKEKFLELQRKEYVRYEDLPLETANGRMINVEFVSYLYLVNNHKVIQCNIRDITKQKLAVDELRISENRLRTLIQTIPDLIWLKDVNGLYLLCNPMFERFFGAKEIDIVGKTDYDFVDKKLADSFRKNDIKAMTADKPTSNEELITFADDGHTEYLETIKAPMYDNNGKLVGVLGIGRDITERKQVAEELFKAKEKAEESDKLKSEFLAQMSHEIRTPINAVLGYVDYLNDLFGDKKNSDAVGCFNGINLASKRIIRTIDLLLNAAELQTGHYQPRFHQIDLETEILHKLYKGQLFSANQRGLELIYNCELNNPKILADDYSTTQIFANLIDNAIKYTKKGKVEILLTKNINGNIVVEIKDTGIGIAKEFLPRLFDAFAQEEQGYTRSFDGNGLGLTLVKRYCEINYALLEVESEKNVGSTFRIIFDKKFTVNTN